MDDAQFYLAEFLRAHGLTVDEAGEWLQVGDVRMAAAIVGEQQHAQDLVIQLDVLALADGEERPICESFAGFGKSRHAALGEALYNFSINSLHVLLAALWGVGEEQVTIEEWEVAGARWRAYLGNYGVRSMEEGEVLPPADAVDRMRDAIEREPLDGRMNWFRWYYGCARGGPGTFEALKNNESWPAGVEALQDIAWPRASEFWSARVFMILRRDKSEAQAA
jgi:hypothetical protein